jgi:hypothetical protein
MDDLKPASGTTQVVDFCAKAELAIIMATAASDCFTFISFSKLK